MCFSNLKIIWISKDYGRRRERSVGGARSQGTWRGRHIGQNRIQDQVFQDVRQGDYACYLKMPTYQIWSFDGWQRQLYDCHCQCHEELAATIYTFLSESVTMSLWTSALTIASKTENSESVSRQHCTPSNHWISNFVKCVLFYFPKILTSDRCLSASCTVQSNLSYDFSAAKLITSNFA